MSMLRVKGYTHMWSSSEDNLADRGDQFNGLPRPARFNSPKFYSIEFDRSPIYMEYSIAGYFE